jgi:hypothetical protein
MTYLTIQQTAAPDFSGVAQLMQGANRSFQDGIESAKGILGKYNEGQQAKGDQALVGALAGLSSEEELSNFLKTTDLSSMNISDTMRKNILTARETILGNNSTRQNTMNAADANSRANAGESRVAAEYTDGVAARNELRAMTPAYTAAYNEGHQYGTGQAPASGTPVGPTLFRATEQQYGLPDGYLATTAHIESGGNPNAHNASGADGLFQFVPSTAQQYGVSTRDPASSTDGAARLASDNAKVLRDKLGREPTGAELYLAHQQGAGGASSLLTNPNARAVDIVGEAAVKQNGGNASMSAGDFAGLWLNKYNGLSGNTPTGAITSNAPNSGPAGAAFANALMNSTHMTPDQAKTYLDNQFANQQAGQSLIDQAESKRQDQVSAAAQMAAVLNPNNLTQSAVQRDLADTAGLDATHRLGLFGKNYDQYAGVIAPAVTQSADVTAAAQIRTDQIGRDQAFSTDNQPFLAAQQFDNSTNTSPGTTISASLPGAAKNPVLAPASIDNAVSAFAKANKLTNGEAAVVFQNIGQGSPELMQKFVSAVNAQSQVNDNWMDTSQNPSPEVQSLNNLADRLFGQSARDSFNSRRIESVAAADLVKQNQSEILLARTSAAKLPVGSPERAQAEAEVRKREVVDMALNQPQQTKQRLANYLQVDPSELAIMTTSEKNAMAAQIEGDKNLSAEEKLLLITATRI